MIMRNIIFIEAKNRNTPEYHFLRTIIELFFPQKEVEFICINGIGNLFHETNINLMQQAQITDNQILVLADADTESKKQGYEKRKNEIENGMAAHQLVFPFFIYPNNQDDGDVETLMESSAQRDLHKIFFDCFEDYERCVSGVKDDCGESKYRIPNLKGKLHTYMNAQKLPRRLSNRFGGGDWLFEDAQFWNLNTEALTPLKEFFATHLK